MRIIRKNTKKLFLYTSLFGLTLSALGVSLGAYFSSQTASAYSADAFVMEIDTTKVSESNTTFVVPTVGNGYNYTVDCDDAGPMAPTTNQSGDYRCIYDSPGLYTVVITGTFPQIRLGQYDSELEWDNPKSLTSVKQWGTQQWRSMERAFAYASNVNIAEHAGVPDLSGVTNMYGMFEMATSFNSDISHWNMSNITNIMNMFSGASSFNQPIGRWDTRNIIDMTQILAGASSFNQSLENWNIQNVNSMSGILNHTAMSTENYDLTLSSWSQQPVKPNLYFGAEGLVFCDSEAHVILSSEPNNWRMSGDVYCDAEPVITDRMQIDYMYTAGAPAHIYVHVKDFMPNATVKIGDQDVEVLSIHHSGSPGTAFEVTVEVNAPLDITQDTAVDITVTNPNGKSHTVENRFTFKVPPTRKVTSAIVSNETGKNIMTVDGVGFFVDQQDMYSTFYTAMNGYSLVTVNGQQLKACLEGTAYEEYGYDIPFLEENEILGFADTPPCYFLMSIEGAPIISETQFRIWLPNNFDTTSPGTVSINGSPIFVFDADNTPAPTEISQPLTPVTPEVTTVEAPLRTATLSVSESEEYQGCASIDADSTRLLAPDTVTTPSDTTLLGGVGFELDCQTVGGSAMVSLQLGAQYGDPATLSAYKDLTDDGTLTPVDVTFVNRDGATYVEFPLTDGLTDAPTGLIDEDGEANGRIVDPLYIGIQSDAVDAGQNGSNGAPIPIGTTPPSFPLPGAPNSGFNMQRYLEEVKTMSWVAPLTATLLTVGGIGLYILRRSR